MLREMDDLDLPRRKGDAASLLATEDLSPYYQAPNRDADNAQFCPES